MSEPLFFKEMALLLDGLVNAPEKIVLHLLAHEEATHEELEDLFDEESRRFVLEWIDRMIRHLVLERFWYPAVDRHTYALSRFAKDMIEHITNFRVVTKGRET